MAARVAVVVPKMEAASPVVGAATWRVVHRRTRSPEDVPVLFREEVNAQLAPRMDGTDERVQHVPLRLLCTETGGASWTCAPPRGTLGARAEHVRRLLGGMAGSPGRLPVVFRAESMTGQACTAIPRRATHDPGPRAARMVKARSRPSRPWTRVLHFEPDCCIYRTTSRDGVLPIGDGVLPIGGRRPPHRGMASSPSGDGVLPSGDGVLPIGGWRPPRRGMASSPSGDGVLPRSESHLEGVRRPSCSVRGLPSGWIRPDPSIGRRQPPRVLRRPEARARGGTVPRGRGR